MISHSSGGQTSKVKVTVGWFLLGALRENLVHASLLMAATPQQDSSISTYDLPPLPLLDTRSIAKGHTRPGKEGKRLYPQRTVRPS